MNSHFDPEALQNESERQQRIVVMTARIRKLHWMRMDDEAIQLSNLLSREEPDAILSPISIETD